MKLYTRSGDDGSTGLFNGRRVRKDDLRVEAYGTVDELNAHLGVCLCVLRSPGAPPGFAALAERLTLIQSELFTLGAELATPADGAAPKTVPAIGGEACRRMETWIDEASAAAPELKTFVLPGGSPAAAQLHACRTVCRRAERRVVTLAEREPIDPQIVIYLNRLSDLLFAWSREANHRSGVADVPWISRPG